MIRIVNLKKRFRKGGGREDFLLDIPLISLKENEIVYFVGPNGSGKTTLLSLIQGQIECDSGEAYVNLNNSNEEIDLLLLEPFKRSKFIGFVPQDSDDVLINEMSIIDHILIGLIRSEKAPWFFPRRRSVFKVEKIIKQFGMGLEKRLFEPVGNLSGGERQVLTFCLASLSKPVVLLLDEFTGALDPEMARKVLNLVISFIRKNKLSAIIVTHRHKEALENADKIVVLHKGKVYKELTPSDGDFNEISLKNIFNQLYTNV